MQLSIIIVNYNSAHLLEKCINSLKPAISGIETEIIIIDNNSADDSWDYIKSLTLTGQSYRMNTNVGFAKGCNRGFGVSQGKYVLFLNPDTILPGSSLKECISFLEQQPDAGAVGVRMINGKGKFLKESKRGLPTPSASFYKLFGLSSIFPKSKQFSKYYEGHVRENELSVVPVLSGAFMMIKREVFEKLNGFDERFFMYGEDIDLSLRITQAGYKNYYLGNITVTHLKGGSTTHNKKYIENFYGAMNLFVEKHYNSKSFIYRCILYSGIFLRKMIAKAALLFNR